MKGLIFLITLIIIGHFVSNSIEYVPAGHTNVQKASYGWFGEVKTQEVDSLSIKAKAEVSKTNYDDTVMIGTQIYAQENIFEINQELNYILEGNRRYGIVDIVPTDTLGYEYAINYKKRYLSPTEYETGTYYYNATTKTLLRIHYTGYGTYYDHYKYVATEDLNKKRELIIIE